MLTVFVFCCFVVFLLYSNCNWILVIELIIKQKKTKQIKIFFKFILKIKNNRSILCFLLLLLDEFIFKNLTPLSIRFIIAKIKFNLSQIAFKKIYQMSLHFDFKNILKLSVKSGSRIVSLKHGIRRIVFYSKF